MKCCGFISQCGANQRRHVSKMRKRAEVAAAAAAAGVFVIRIVVQEVSVVISGRWYSSGGMAFARLLS
ncbi:hypothetical protein LIA77_10809 [Sarocladium implicatum]|nr:hypothetical protein LIA77_10809 [Sarocladium implicatum]